MFPDGQILIGVSGKDPQGTMKPTAASDGPGRLHSGGHALSLMIRTGSRTACLCLGRQAVKIASEGNLPRRADCGMRRPGDRVRSRFRASRRREQRPQYLDRGLRWHKDHDPQDPRHTVCAKPVCREVREQADPRTSELGTDRPGRFSCVHWRDAQRRRSDRLARTARDRVSA